jgi:hypothetical protein
VSGKYFLDSFFSCLPAKPVENVLGGDLPTKLDDGAPVVVGKAYDFVLWLLPKVETFPRSHRFTLGERLSAQGLDVLVILTEAAYTSSKDELLTQANRKINSTRLLLRLAKDLKLLSLDAYAFSAERLDEIGRMVGGWRKTTVQRK